MSCDIDIDYFSNGSSAAAIISEEDRELLQSLSTLADKYPVHPFVLT